MKRVLVTGAAGFIGHHLARRLKADGCHVTGVDISPPEYGLQDFDAFFRGDLRREGTAGDILIRGGVAFDEVYHLAADMGGMGYIATHDADVVTNNLLIDANVLAAARVYSRRLLYTSSACVYPEHRQMDTASDALRESDAYPANPDTGYGWEKLLTERMCRYDRQDYGLETRIARLHNVFGPEGTWYGGREKAPAALMRKVLEAKRDGRAVVPIWGDGQQTRSFLYVSDAVEGIIRLMRSDYTEPLNIGSDRSISIRQLARIAGYVAGHDIDLEYTSGPQGVRGRNADLELCRRVLDWSPQVSLEDGMRRLCAWMEPLVMERAEVAA